MKKFFKEHWQTCGIILAGVCLMTLMVIALFREHNRRVPAVEESVQHTRVIEQCNRINLLSCIACHDFPAYVIDVQPEIWEE